MLTALVVALVLGSALCFGGAVWWFRPAFASLASLFSLAMLVRLLLERRVPIFKSPLTLLAFLALGLGLLQLIPLPASLARRLSPTAQEIYSFGVIPDLARADLPSVELGEPAQSGRRRRSIAPRPCAGFSGPSRALGLLGRLAFCRSAQTALSGWGCVLAAFLLNGALGLVQITGGVDGLYGFLRPGASAGLGTLALATSWIRLRR